MVAMDNDNYNMPTASIVAQFTVFTNTNGLSKLLNLLQENELNISAFTTQEKDNNLAFKFIIGESYNQSPNDINFTRGILKQYKFRFEESKAVRFSNFQNKYSLAKQYYELAKVLTIYSFYLGEDGSIIYQTCCPTKTLKVLDKFI